MESKTRRLNGFEVLASEPVVRWALKELLRDEVGHGAFGEDAGAWAMRGWIPERRLATWPACVTAMELIERRTGGPVGPRANERDHAAVNALGAPGSVVVGVGMLRAVPRWVLPGTSCSRTIHRRTPLG
jgi:hypothetical protein